MKQTVATLPWETLTRDRVLSPVILQSPIFLYCLLLYIAVPNFEGVLRYFLLEVNLPELIYFRDVMLVTIILYFLIKSIITYNMNKIILSLIIILSIHSLVGFFYVSDPLMVLFGWKIFLPLFLGIVMYPLVVNNLNEVKWIFLIILLASITGVFFSYFIDPPWEKLKYSIGMFNIVGTQEDTIGLGIKRLAGFARVSWDAAIQIFVLAIFVMAHFKNIWLKMMVWILAGIAILLTTAKGIYLSYLICTLFLILNEFGSKWLNQVKLFRKYYLLLISLMILLPVLTYNKLVEFPVLLQGDIENLILSSFAVRMEESWPGDFEMIMDNGNLFLGRGLGGIGVSQMVFEHIFWRSADNLFIYLFGHFGLMGVFYLLYFYYKSRSLDSSKELFFSLFLLLSFQYGITQSIIEHPYFPLFLGFFLAHMSSPELRHTYLLNLSPQTEPKLHRANWGQRMPP